MVPCSFLDDNVDAKHCQILMGRRRKENKVNVENVFKRTRRMRQKGNWLYLNPSTGFVYQKVRGVLNKAFVGGTDCNTVNSPCNGHHRDQDWVSVKEKVRNSRSCCFSVISYSWGLQLLSVITGCP